MAQPQPTQLRYPPFPPIPPDTHILPYSRFQERGIELHGVNDVEVDTLGVPTVTLRVRHNTDRCKTFTNGKQQQHEKAVDQIKAKSTLNNLESTVTTTVEASTAAPSVTLKKKKLPKDPVERAIELRKQRILLFANKLWYEQWSEGEGMRGISRYDSTLTVVDRIHHAANDFRSGRIWPVSSSGLGYLWDQFRLFAGLLGQPPVWYRTDLEQTPDQVVDEIEGADEEAAFEGATVAVGDDEDLLCHDDRGTATTTSQSTKEDGENPPPPQRKYILARTPYALHNIVPIPLSSASQVKTLLSIASLSKYQKLDTFIYSPDTRLRIFFSWYLHHQGFIFSSSYLNNLPRLVLFFLEFLLRTGAIHESERALKAAIEITKRAVVEVPATGRICKHLLPDMVGVGCMALWGRKWVEEEVDQPFLALGTAEEEGKREALRKFEEELKSENVHVISAEQVLPPLNEKDEVVPEISIQVVSPTSLESSNGAFIEEGGRTMEEKEVPKIEVEVSPIENKPVDSTSTRKSPFEANQSIPHRWDTEPSNTRDKCQFEAWQPIVHQPLLSILGMTNLPVKYKSGLAERSMRRVREIVPKGCKAKEVGCERKWKFVQADLVERLARVVLEPWLDWDDGGIAMGYRRPRIRRQPELGDSEEGGHDPERGVIVVLVEPRVAEQLSVGMGIAGTWVQMVRERMEDGFIGDWRGNGRGRGRGRGGRGGGGPTASTNIERPTADGGTEGAPTTQCEPESIHRGGGRGHRGGGRGGYQRGPNEKDFVFWYVEDVLLVVPSFWMAGKEDDPITMPSSSDEELDELSDLED